MRRLMLAILALGLAVFVDGAEPVEDGAAGASTERTTESSANSTDEEKAAVSKETRSFVFAGTQRRLPSNNTANSTSRDTQLLLLLAARRRQLLTDRLNAHIATLATLSQKPYRGNGTHAHLEIFDKNNTVITKFSLPENATNVKLQWDPRTVNIKSVVRTEAPSAKSLIESNSADFKQSPLSKILQDTKTVRSGFLNNRRKSPIDGLRFGVNPRKALLDFQVTSDENSNVKKDDALYSYSKKQDDEQGEALVEPDEEFQVDESNHGFYLLNFTAENITEVHPNFTSKNTISDSVEIKFPLFSTENLSKVIDDTENLINRNVRDDYTNLTQGHLRASEIAPVQLQTKLVETRTNKEIKVDNVVKENDNNTLFISDELYNHFRPLESELPVEDMEPFLFFGQKININNLQKENITLIANISPSTKAVQYLTTSEKKRNLYRLPVTEKTKYFKNDDEEEINEDMDVSVVKNIIEKNKVRNTIKQPVPVRESGLVNAYRKTSTTELPGTSSLVPDNLTLMTSKIMNQAENNFENNEANGSESRLRVKEQNIAYNRSSVNPSRGNRTYTFRRKPAKMVVLNTTNAGEFVTMIEPTVPPVPPSTTLVYTAVVTSVSITSSIKGQNRSETKNDTQIINKSISEETFIDRLNNNTAKELIYINSTLATVKNATEMVTADITTPNIAKSNETDTTEIRIRKRPEFRHRSHRIRTRISTTEKNVASNITDTAATPFILYPVSTKSDNKTISVTIIKEVTTVQPTQARKSNNLKSSTSKDADNEEAATKTSVGTRIFVPDEVIGQGKKEIGVIPGLSSTTSSTTESNMPLIDNIALNETLGGGNVTLEVSLSKIKDYGGNILNTSSENSSYYYTDSATSESVQKVETTSHIITGILVNTNGSTSPNITTNSNNNDTKELLTGKTGDVLIEAGNTNMATYILAGLGFVPIAVIVFFVMRNFLIRKAKDIDTEYEGYFQDPDLKKDAQVTPVARPPMQQLKKPDEKWEFPRSKLRLQTLLGQGNFGQVWKAEADDLTGHDGLTRLVAVKTIKETASQKDKQELLHEICIMHKIGTHPNVVTLLACCTEQEPYLLIMEYVMCGKLLTYLRERRSRPDRFGGGSGALTSRDLTVFAYCVARGMEYLASKGVVHRDLAARNILVDHNKLCKIADFGMSREVSVDNDGSSGESGRSQRHALPVRWMAPEALLYNIYSHETDVWAYGVLLWEIVTLGSTPYATMSGRQVLHMVTEGYRLERPAHCKPHLYRTMHACWHSDPSHRPPFSEIKKQLAELLDNEPTEGNYVDLESFYQDSSVYSDPSAIIQNDGGISLEYSRELKPQAFTEEPKRRSFDKLVAACNLQRNHSSGNFGSRNGGFNPRDDDFINLRSNSYGSKIGATRMGGFGISNIAFNARDGDFGERKDKLSGLSFQNRDRENNLIARDNTSATRNSFSAGYQNRHGCRDGNRGFFISSGSNRSKRISEFECNI